MNGNARGIKMRKRNTLEKPKGRRRRLRDSEANLPKPASVTEAPSTQYILSSDNRKMIPGNCRNDSCGAEAACLQAGNNTYYCVCTNNMEAPTDDLKCPRSTVPLTPNPIKNVMPPRRNAKDQSAEAAKSLISGDIYPEATTGSDLPIIGTGLNDGVSRHLVAATLVGGAMLLVLIVVGIISCYIRRRNCVKAGKKQPRVRPGEPLLAERYITNPQYGVCGTGLHSHLPASTGTLDPEAAHGDTQVLHIDRQALSFLEEVGEGCFGKVHKGLLRTLEGEDVVAIKVLKESAGRNAEDDFVREVSIMSAFRHPNILSLIGVVYREDINGSPWMVFEYMEWGDLAGVLRGSRGGGRARPALDEAALLRVALQVAHGMQYLAARRFVHRDLAARNCLVGANLAVKIADFGMSRDVYTCDYYKMGGERPMPVRWMSPESIVYARFTHESDVWSYGVVLWEIYSRGKQPFYGHNNDGATKLILEGILLVPPEECPSFACDLMRACWRSDPRERINFDEICTKLGIAVETCGPSTQIRLPRPPAPPQDSAGYLVPARGPPADYLATLPDPEVTDSESSEEEEDEEYS